LIQIAKSKFRSEKLSFKLLILQKKYPNSEVGQYGKLKILNYGILNKTLSFYGRGKREMLIQARSQYGSAKIRRSAKSLYEVTYEANVSYASYGVFCDQLCGDLWDVCVYVSIRALSMLHLNVLTIKKVETINFAKKKQDEFAY